MNGPDSRRRALRPGRPAAGGVRRGLTQGGRRRTFPTVLAREAAHVEAGRALFRRLLNALLRTALAALAAVPFAAAWGIGHAEVHDYLGPNQVTFASNFSGEVKIDLGPIGNAYLDSPARPIGMTITVGGVGPAAQSLTALLSERTLVAYTRLYAEPEATVDGIVELLLRDAVVEALKVEAVLLLCYALLHLRGELLSPWVVRQVTPRRAAATYATVVALVLGSILAPAPPNGTRIPLSVAASSRLGSVTVDSALLADLLDRAVEGIRLLSDRQQRAVQKYVNDAYASLTTQLGRRPAPAPGETMLMGLSDLHCNEALTELITRLVRATEPALVMSAGDDTVNGTAAERGCIRREAKISGPVPFVVATGNHDSDITETQMKNDGMVVLDGAVVDRAGISVLGDDDPEHNVPFSVTRLHDRPESEEQMAERLVDVARGRRTDVVLVHQPVAARVIMQAPDVPARLVVWGHFHREFGPTVVSHSDGSWTVGMQQGTAGGVREPTLTSFSTPFSPPLISADVYFYFRDDATGLITAVQPVHFLPDATVVIDQRIPTGDLALLPPETRMKLTGSTAAPTSAPLPTQTPAPTPTATPTPPAPEASPDVSG